MPRKPPERTYAPEQTRRVLLEAALDLFAERGFGGTSMQEVADRANVTKGAFYYHFSTKENALHIIHDQFIDRALAAQENALQRYDSPTSQLAQMAFDTTMVCIDFRKHVKVFFREQHGLTGEVRNAILRKRQQSTRLYQDVLRRGILCGEFAHDVDADVGALGLLGMWIWVYQWYRPEGKRTPTEIALQFTTMTLRGIGVPQPASEVLGQPTTSYSSPSASHS